MEHKFRSLPSVDRLLTDDRLADVVARYSRERIADVARSRLAEARRSIASGASAPSADALIAEIANAAAVHYDPSLRRVINATGVIIHTNLGRAVLSDEAVEGMRAAAAGYTNLELDLATGDRGSRHAHLDRLLRELTGADDGLVVNNNAAAVMLALRQFAEGREVIVSRGEAVEIGGGFRIPEILQQSGARLVEVGTTNRTYLADYEAAVTERTAAYLKVHPSNFRISGFTHAPSMAELVESANKRKLLLLNDLGSGCLLDTRQFGLAAEPTVQQAVADGANLVCFSGDKLLGGPQAGIIVGKKGQVQTLKRNPMVRALRVDKMTTAALETTLLHYAKGEAVAKIPVWRMIAMTPKELDRRARRWAKVLGEGARVVDAASTVGGGSLPGETLPTRALAIPGEGASLEQLARRLREAPVPVMARVERDMLLLDPRTVLPTENRALLDSLHWALTP
ncbi:MAG: L-seryl-tRNA(Sec) selenium transferase [Chloroflexi bacterium]|nr:L-seryl-tRNA(Sec) selenium transferase [Chloroflexota bacterium]